MPTLASRHRSFPLVRGARRALTFSVLCASATLTACGGGGGGNGSGGTGPNSQRATMTLTSQVLLAAGTTGASLQITPAYDLTSGAPVALAAAQTVAVSGASQQVPLTVDLAGCLANPAHSGGDACNVRVTVALVAGGRVLDTQTVGPVALRGGATVAQSVSLAEVASVRVTLPAPATVGADGRAQLQTGQTVTAAAAALDANGGVLAGRLVSWSVDAPSVAAVDAATGVVTPATPGQARLTATVSGRTGTLDLVVLAPIAVVVTSGAGSGTVTSSPAGITCTVTAGVASGTCAAGFAGPGSVTLTVTPAAGSSFAGWARDCATFGGAVTCTLTPGTARTAGVAFVSVQNLAVTLAGAGTGRVTSDPAGITCQKSGGVCTTGFTQGASVTLRATADAGSDFTGWSGEGCSGTSTCVVAMSQARAVTATFTSIPADTITVSAVGPLGLQGSLSVGGVLKGQAFTPGAIVINLNTSNAAPQFTFYVDRGTQPTLNFTAINGATFTSWGGACAGTATTATCTPTPRSKNAVVVNLAP